MRLEHNVQQVVQDANLEIQGETYSIIQGIQDRVTFDAKEFELEKKKNAEILDQLSEKTRQLKKLQIMYDKLKRKASIEIHQQQLISAESSQLMPADNYDGVYERYDQRRPAGVSQSNLVASGFQLKRFLNLKR